LTGSWNQSLVSGQTPAGIDLWLEGLWYVMVQNSVVAADDVAVVAEAYTTLPWESHEGSLSEYFRFRIMLNWIRWDVTKSGPRQEKPIEKPLVTIEH